MPAFSAEISEITAAPQKQLDPSHIMQVGMGFFARDGQRAAVRVLGRSDADFAGWCTEAGFRTVEVVPLTGPASAGIAYK
jgi:hypothetical protein